MFDNLFYFAGTTGTAAMLLTLLLTLTTAIMVGLCAREREALRGRPVVERRARG